MTASKAYVKAKCRDCKKQITVKHASMVAYRKAGREPMCDECRILVFRTRNNLKTLGTCDKCGSSFETNKNNYDHKRRHELLCYCPKCTKIKTAEGVRAANYRIWQSRRENAEKQAAKEATNRYEAPCGRVIVNVLERRGTRHNGVCHACNWSNDPNYWVCLSMADKRNWESWTIKED